VEHIWGKK